MNRDRLRLAILALLAIVGTAAAAATLDEVTRTGIGPGGGGTGAGSGPGGVEPFELGLGDTSGEGGLEGDAGGGPDLSEYRWILAVGVLVVAGLAAVVYRRQGALAAGVVILALSTPVFVIAILLLADPASGTEGIGLGGNASEISIGLIGQGGGGGTARTRSPYAVPTALVVLVGLALVGVVVFFRSTDDDEIQETDGESDDAPATAHLSAVGVAAGRAADRIENDRPVENEVYRAWREMVERLDIDRPASTTPEEFATAATAAGMNAEDVETLTDLFRGVRYGEQPATDDRVERALAALRRIEQTYAEQGDDDR